MTTTSHVIYLIVSLMITVWVARTLSTNGRPFLITVFGKETVADAVNHLLVVGFYLLNIAFVALALRFADPVHNTVELIEQLSTRIGFVLAVLGGMHCVNLTIFCRLRRRREKPMWITEFLD